MHKILLITPSSLSDLDGGAVFVRRIVDAIPTDRLSWLVCGGHGRSVPDWMARFPRLQLSTSLLHHRYARGAAVRSPLRRRYLQEVDVDSPVRQLDAAIHFARAQKVERIYVYAKGPAIVLGTKLAAALSIPLHVSLHDDIRGWYEPADLVQLEPYFRELLVRSSTADVATEALRAMYCRRYGVEINGRAFLVGGGARTLPACPQVSPRARRIAHAGGVWCPEAFIALFEGLKLLSRNGATADYTVTMFGDRRPDARLMRYPFVRYGGLVPMDDVPGVLGSFDLLYCPMSFMANRRSLTEFSLPSKLLTYFQAQVPVLAHGPEYASNVALIREHDVGLAMTSDKASDLARLLDGYSGDAERRRRHAATARELAETTYAPARVVTEFLQFLDG